jgi:hypothetical protein
MRMYNMAVLRAIRLVFSDAIVVGLIAPETKGKINNKPCKYLV